MTSRERALALQQARRDPQHEHDGNRERRRVDRVCGRRAGRRDQDPADQRPQRPAQVLDPLEQRVGAGQLLVGDEVRNPGVDGRAEEAGRETGHRCKGDHGRRVRREGQRDEDPDPHGVRADHQRAALEPVEKRPEQEPDHDGRQELDDEDGGNPGAGVRPLLDVDGQRDGVSSVPALEQRVAKKRLRNPSRRSGVSWADENSRACARKYHLCRLVTRRPKGRVPTRPRRTRSPPVCRL